MFNNLKYFFLYCYEAADKMEEKADVFAQERAKRMEIFRGQRQEAEDKARAKFDEMRAEAQRQVGEALNRVGVARKEEIDELKKLITNLSKKVDKLAKS
ncbi:MAG: phasin family protein [Actinomycetota bacterium]|nr:phasin family protein [Actinomycetota bacterium]